MRNAVHAGDAPRAGYLEVAPDLERFFVMGTTDDERGMSLTMAVQPGTSVFAQMLASSPMLLSVLNSVLAGTIVALLALQLAAVSAVAVGLGAAGFIVTMVGFSADAGREIGRSRSELTPMFPTREAPPA